jgi:hypothetical protein
MEIRENCSKGLKQLFDNGELIEIIDGETLQIHDREIRDLLRSLK